MITNIILLKKTNQTLPGLLTKLTIIRNLDMQLSYCFLEKDYNVFLQEKYCLEIELNDYKALLLEKISFSVKLKKLKENCKNRKTFETKQNRQK